MSNIEFIPPIFATPFSSGVRVGDILYLSGQIGILPNGSLADGFADQARQTMQNISSTLATAGLGMGNIFKATVMLDDMTRWQEFNAVYLEFFHADRLPARSAFSTNGLALGAHLEVECMAYFD